MINHIIENFQPRFGDRKVNIDCHFGETSHPEGFRLEARKVSGAVDAKIFYRDESAIRYALNSLLKFIDSESDSLNIEEAPDFPIRGVVEGFYGKPWSHQQRIKALRHFGDFNFNTYFIAPKDVP